MRVRFIFPVVACCVLSIVLTVLLNACGYIFLR
jgi:hypothetical protein